jgi:hypothetical protein
VVSTIVALVLLTLQVGSSISYYADRDPKGGAIALSLDGMSANITGQALGPYSLFKQRLWNATGLDSSDHQLVVSAVSGTMGLDYLEWVVARV